MGQKTDRGKTCAEPSEVQKLVLYMLFGKGGGRGEVLREVFHVFSEKAVKFTEIM